MSTLSGQLDNRRLRAPREDRAALVEPPLADVSGLVQENVRLREGYRYDFQGRSISQLSHIARAELLAEARKWTSTYRSIGSASMDPARLMFLAGHQPELFHPGVWFKNFALGALAKRHGAAAINLVIDSDTVKSTSLRMPGGTAASPRLDLVAFDRPEPRVPYEERQIVDRALFTDFDRRVAEQIASLVPNPLIRQFWPLVLEQAQRTTNLGACLAAARHQLEGRWGLETLEIPQSWVCESESFCWLVVHLLANLARFRETYNGAVSDYRHWYRIRNAAHPVPDLAADDPWIEAPLWVWTTEDPRRRRLFARSAGSETILSDREGLEIRISLTPEGDGTRAVEQLLHLAQRGVKIRSRALVTTLWARLVLGDVFMHGIGGAKYDQVTDLILQRFFGLQPLGIMVLSATLLLPTPRPRKSVERLRGIRRELRELDFHPERFLDLDVADAELAVEWIGRKRRWIEMPQTPENAHERWQAFRQINEALQPWVAPRRRQLLVLQQESAQEIQAEKILASREHAFCIYPEATLREFLKDLLPKTS
jgi:hypothetical protein